MTEKKLLKVLARQEDKKLYKNVKKEVDEMNVGFFSKFFMIRRIMKEVKKREYEENIKYLNDFLEKCRKGEIE